MLIYVSWVQLKGLICSATQRCSLCWNRGVKIFRSWNPKHLDSSSVVDDWWMTRCSSSTSTRRRMNALNDGLSSLLDSGASVSCDFGWWVELLRCLVICALRQWSPESDEDLISPALFISDVEVGIFDQFSGKTLTRQGCFVPSGCFCFVSLLFLSEGLWFAVVSSGSSWD